MSQSGILSITNNPSVPISFTTNSGIAVPVANNLNVFGGTGITTSGSGSTLTISISGSGEVTSITGTASQVLANGTTGTPQSGAVTLTLPQSIATTSSPTFSSLTATVKIVALGSVSSPNLIITGSSSGIITMQGQAASGTYNFNMPTTSGSSGDVLTSAGGGSSAMTWTTPSSSFVTSITGTTYQIAASASTGAVTLSLPSSGLSIGAFAADTPPSGGMIMSGALGVATPSVATNTVFQIDGGAYFSCTDDVAYAFDSSSNARLGIVKKTGVYPTITVAQGANMIFAEANTTNLITTAVTGYVLTQRMIIDSTGKVAIGTSAPDSSSLLSIFSTSLGFLPPSMSTTQKSAISGPTAGLMVYDNSLNDLQFYNGSSWVSSSGVTSIAGTANQIAASASTGAVTLSLTNGISLGSYQGTSPPLGGMLIPGSVSIGTTNASYMLEVAGDANVSYVNCAIGLYNTAASGGTTRKYAIGPRTDGSLAFADDTASAIRMTLTSTGNFSIGDTTATSLFNVGSSNQFQVNSSGDVVAGIWQGTLISPTYGGTGVNNGSKTITLGSFTSGYVLTSDGSGNATWQAVPASAVTSVTGTVNQVIAFPTTGAVELSLPQNINSSADVTFGEMQLSNQGEVLAFTSETGSAGQTYVSFYSYAGDTLTRQGYVGTQSQANNGGLELSVDTAGGLIISCYSGTAGNISMNVGGVQVLELVASGTTALFGGSITASVNKTLNIGTSSDRFNTVYNATNTTGTSRLAPAQINCAVCANVMMRGTGTLIILGQTADYIPCWCVNTSCSNIGIIKMDVIQHLPQAQLAQIQQPSQIKFLGFKVSQYSGNSRGIQVCFDYGNGLVNSTYLSDTEYNAYQALVSDSDKINFIQNLGLIEWNALEITRLLAFQCTSIQSTLDASVKSFVQSDLLTINIQPQV